MKITERDMEIIVFILAMKFASAQDVHQKFFKRKRDGTVSNSEWYTRERLRYLVEMGYLQVVRYRFEQKNYYIGTKHGYDLINHMCISQTPTKPIQQIDVRTFDHDIAVMRSRLLIEECEGGIDWQSERQLKCDHPEYFDYRSSRDACPDGIYKSQDVKLIAFEYEIAQKSKKRYQNKVREYAYNVRERKLGNSGMLAKQGPKYDLVRFICEKDSVYKILKDSSVLYEEYISVELASEFFNSRKQLIEVTPVGADGLSVSVH